MHMIETSFKIKSNIHRKWFKWMAKELKISNRVVLDNSDDAVPWLSKVSSVEKSFTLLSLELETVLNIWLD